jgi:parvulin-like peptidyl-prolyl isomerase
MRYLVFTIVAVCMFFAPLAAAELIDEILATVDTEVILRSDVMSEIAPLLMDLQSRAQSQTELDREMEKAVREALDQAVEYKILYREAQLAGLELPEAVVEDRMEKIIGRYESRDAFMEMLQQAGETMSDFRERMRKQIMAISMGLRKRGEFEQEAVVSEVEVRQYYLDHKDKFSRPDRVKLRRLFMPAGKAPAERAKVKARLESLREEAVLGADFAELAKRWSKGPAADEGGALGWIVRGDLVKPLEDAAFALAEGSVSTVIETEFGFSLLKATEKESAGLASFEEVRTEIEPVLRGKYADERYSRWMNELRKRSRVRIYL